ncbi:MAG: N-methyl-L-tryptophan oxidase [Actinomycetota bacterium]
MRDYEYVVIGLGGIGSAAAYWLARAGADVLGIEQFELGHERGASQDHSRIIRLAYHRPEYVRLASHAYDAWTQLETDVGKALLVRTGGLDLAPAEGAISLTDYERSLAVEGVPFEALDAHEVMNRWPQFRLSDDVRTVYQADAGIAPAADCNASHIHAAREHGAALVENRRVDAVRMGDGEFDLSAGNERFSCRRLVVAADAWTNDVLRGLGVRLPLTVTQEQVTYLAAPDAEAFTPSRFPIWIWNDEPSFYGMPAYGEAGPKVAQDVGGKEVTAGTRTFEPDPENLRRVLEFASAILPSMVGPVLTTKTCLYTLTPDRDFVIDEIPSAPGAFVALGAAHGFKFASVLGRISSELAIDGRTAHDLEMFRMDRPVLLMEDPPRTFFI